MKPSGQPLLDMDGVAARLGTTHRHVRRLVDQRAIPFFKVGGKVRFDPADIERWLTHRRVEAGSTGSTRRLRAVGS